MQKYLSVSENYLRLVHAWYLAYTLYWSPQVTAPHLTTTTCLPCTWTLEPLRCRVRLARGGDRVRKLTTLTVILTIIMLLMMMMMARGIRQEYDAIFQVKSTVNC